MADPTASRFVGSRTSWALHRWLSAEIDFVDSVGYVVGDVGDGFKIMVTAMLNSSRWLNAVGDVAILRRAYLEAGNYATVRTAFGRPIAEFPLVRSQLGRLEGRMARRPPQHMGAD